MSESAFLQDLALITAVAGFAAVLFTRLKWPKVIGYILAGVLISRHTWGVGVLADESSVQTIAQLGVVFLMLTLGLEFSASGMKTLKNVTFPTAIFDTAVMTWIGYTIGRSIFGWQTVPSLFLGAAICDSSTTLLAKIIGEMKWSSRPFVKYVIGTSICEDMICVGLIALVAGVANGGGMDFAAVGKSLGALAVFLLAATVFGLILVPRALSAVSRRGDDETLLLTLLGCCFIVTLIAYRLKFSMALGAFLAGVFGASCGERAKLHRLAEPLRTMFAAVFFVSIGLLVDIRVCFENAFSILLLSAVVVCAKAANCFAGALACGERLKTAVQMGFGLAQIGEFAYLVALLYLSMSRDTSSPMYQIVVGVSLLTTVMNPLMLKLSDRAGDWAERKCPERISRLLDAYRAALVKFRTYSSSESEARRTVRAGVVELGVIATLEFAIAFAMSILNGRDWSGMSVFFDGHKRFVFCLATNVFSVAMFVPAVAVSRRIGAAIGDTLAGGGGTRWHQAAGGMVRLVVLVAVAVLFVLELLMINVNLAPSEPWARWFVAASFVAVAVFGWRFFAKAGKRAMNLLSEALDADRRAAAGDETRSLTIPPDSFRRVVIGESSPAIGETVVSLNIRAKTGASVVSLERDGETMGNPGPETRFRAGDTLGVMGEREQVEAARKLLGEDNG